jgi:hypothetical protein
MSERQALQDAITKATADRAASEHFVNVLRSRLAAWRTEEADRNPLLGALLWSHNEAWTSRLERLVVEVEAHITTLRTHETQLTQKLAGLPAEPPPAPPIATRSSMERVIGGRRPGSRKR